MLDKASALIQRSLMGLIIAFAALFSHLSAQEQIKPENLFEISLEELMNVEVVSASKVAQKISEVPAVVRVITADQIKRRGCFTLEEALADLPGFQFRNILGLNSYVFLRGVPNQNNLILVLVDGVRINELNSGGFYAGGHYNLSNVERIEVVYGPASVLYGTNAMSGVINIITRSPEKNGGYISSSLGGFATRKIDFGFEHFKPEKKLGLLFSGVYKKSDKADLKGVKGDNNWTDNMDNFEDDLSFDAKLKDDNLTLGLTFQDKKTSMATYYKTIGSQYLDSGTEWHIRFINGYAKYVYDKPDKWSVQSTAYYRNTTVEDNTIDHIIMTSATSSGDQVGAYRPNSLIGVENQLNLKLWKKLPLIAGLTVERESLSSSISYSHSYSQYEKPPKPPAPERTINRLTSLFLQTQYYIVDSVSLTAGVGQDFSSYYGDVFTPRTGLVFNRGKLTAKLLYDEAFRAPKPWDYTYGAGNPGLKPEKMRAGEFFFSYMISKSVNIDASLYRNTIRGKLIKDLEENNWINLGNVMTNGIELNLQHAVGKIKSYANYTYTNSEDQHGRPIPEIAKHTANAGVEYAFTPKFQAEIRGNYIGERNNTKIIPATGNLRVGDAVVLNAGLSYLNYYGFDFYLDVKNLFNAEYYHTSNLEPARYRQPQRMLLIGLEYDFRY